MATEIALRVVVVGAAAVWGAAVSAGDCDGNGMADTAAVGDFLQVICTELDFRNVSVTHVESRPGERISKYVLPARADPLLLPTVFQNTNRYSLHEEFLRGAFPERYGGLTGRAYNQLVRTARLGTITSGPSRGCPRTEASSMNSR